MNLFADNPVFQREARWGRRLRRLGRNRPLAVMAAFVALTVGWLYWQGLNSYVDPQAPYDNGGLWRTCSNIYLGLIVLLAPTLASSAISQEKEQQTWEALALTKLTAPQILAGKWLARLIPLGGIALLLLPLFLISAASGIDLSALPGILLFLSLTAAVYGLVGLTCSFVARKTLTATTVALVITGLLCVGTWVASQLLDGLGRSGGDYALMLHYSHLPSPLWLNPFYVLSLLSQRSPLNVAMPAYGYGGMQQVYYSNSYSYGYSGYGMTPWQNVSDVLTFYGATALAVIGLCFYYMLTRYRRTVRGGRPLGEPLT